VWVFQKVFGDGVIGADHDTRGAILVINFENILYLQQGSSVQQRAYTVLTSHNVFTILKSFEPILTGTIPIGVDIEDSDLDIACCWYDIRAFIDCVTENFSPHSGFSLREVILKGRPTVIANFRLDDFDIEIFGQNRPVKDQESFRHMMAEYALLQQHGETFRQQVIALKRSGMKTEPAFAQLLGLMGDPYLALLKLDKGQDSNLFRD